ncbi:unnamed protein product, partial [Discosporangium mesarthrocarpum]
VQSLCQSLAKCRPHYVRCIKPNGEKQPNGFNYDVVTHQVKYLGLQENIRVRRQGYAHRLPFAEFLRRYRFVSEATWPDKRIQRFWPDGVPYDPAHPEAPEHLLRQYVGPSPPKEVNGVNGEASSSEEEVLTDDALTDKETASPPVNGNGGTQKSKPPMSRVRRLSGELRMGVKTAVTPSLRGVQRRGSWSSG